MIRKIGVGVVIVVVGLLLALVPLIKYWRKKMALKEFEALLEHAIPTT